MPEDSSLLIAPEDYAKLMRIHLALHSQTLLSKKIIRTNRPDKLTSLTTFKGRTLVTQNLRKYPDSQGKVPSHVRRTRELAAKGGRYCVTWMMNPGYNQGFEMKLVSTHHSSYSDMGVFEVYKLGPNWTETKIFTENVAEVLKPTFSLEPGVHYVGGSLFDSGATGVIGSVNTVGVMGAGVALAISQRYPQIIEPYLEAVRERGKFGIGKALYLPLRDLILTLESDIGKTVILLPTKGDWRVNSSLEVIELALKALVRTYRQYDISSLSTPALGCSMGGLDWKRVKPMVEDYFGRMDIPVYIHEEYGGMDDVIPSSMPEQRIITPDTAIDIVPADGSIVGF